VPYPGPFNTLPIRSQMHSAPLSIITCVMTLAPNSQKKNLEKNAGKPMCKILNQAYLTLPPPGRPPYAGGGGGGGGGVHPPA
jgi:hypothetical protein